MWWLRLWQALLLGTWLSSQIAAGIIDANDAVSTARSQAVDNKYASSARKDRSRLALATSTPIKPGVMQPSSPPDHPRSQLVGPQSGIFRRSPPSDGAGDSEIPIHARHRDHEIEMGDMRERRPLLRSSSVSDLQSDYRPSSRGSLPTRRYFSNRGQPAEAQHARANEAVGRSAEVGLAQQMLRDVLGNRAGKGDPSSCLRQIALHRMSHPTVKDLLNAPHSSYLSPCLATPKNAPDTC